MIDTATPTTVEKYRQLRRDIPWLPASQAILWARHSVNEEKLPFEETGDRITARIERDGFSINATFSPDYHADTSWLGVFTDTWAPNAIKNPRGWYDGGDGEMTERSRDYFAWIVPCNDPDEAWKFYKATHSRHEAWLLSRRQQREDAKKLIEISDNQYTIWGLIVRVYRKGVELDMDGLYGIDLGDWNEWDQHATSIAADVIDTTLESAKEQLKELAQEFTKEATIS